MTREETSIYFKNHTESFCVTGKCREAEKMAIKALEQELPTTKNDLGVDNQNIRLIDANALIKRLRPKHFDWWGEGEQDDFGKGNNSMLEEVIEAIEEFPSVTPQPCEDAISRKAVINQIFYSTDNNGDVVLGSVLRERIARLPSVTPQEPRSTCGNCKEWGTVNCSETYREPTKEDDVCDSYKADMREVEE